MAFVRKFLLSALICFGGLWAVAKYSAKLSAERESAAPLIVEAPPPPPQAAPAPAPVAGAAAEVPKSGYAGGHPANADLRINDAGLAIIKESEGLRLQAYSGGGQWLIGYGHSRTAREGMTVTEAEAEALLRDDVRNAENDVKRVVGVEVNANEFSAMVSLAYNLGGGAFARSRVVERLNAGDRGGAADGFLFHNRAGGVPNEHLTERREKERALFLT